jgi:hypothetical protein
MDQSPIPLAEHLKLQHEFQRLQMAYLAQQRELNQLQTAAVQSSLADVEARLAALQAN